MHTESIEYHAEGRRYVGYLAVDRARPGKRPGILVSPEGNGNHEGNKARARALAELGYVALAIDYHGEGEVIAGMPEMMARLATLRADPTPIRGITRAALGALTAQDETDAARLGAIGYCYGGTAVLELARSGAGVACTVGFHSGLATARPEDAKHITGKILVCIGAEDPLIPPAERAAFEAEMRAAKVDWRLYLFGNAVHGFANPDADKRGMPATLAYHKPTADRSWRAMRDLFDETFYG
jgi:dienelactone hydrolase